MKFYKRETVFDEEFLLKHLIAHKILKLPIDEGYINFSALAKTMSNELEGWFHGKNKITLNAVVRIEGNIYRIIDIRKESIHNHDTGKKE